LLNTKFRFFALKTDEKEDEDPREYGYINIFPFEDIYR